MATLGGAKALGLEADIGSLEIGKYADIIAIKLDHLSCQPIFNLHSTLVYNNRHIDITHSWVEGRLLVKNGELTTLNENAIKARAQHWRDHLKNTNTLSS
jgi:5-methylthioadenosine/S-adenosylhomocysteine deaminase